MVNIGDITIQPQAAVGTPPYVGDVAYDLSTASGTQAITGVGFKPSFVLIWGLTQSTRNLSMGFSNGGSQQGWQDKEITGGNYYESSNAEVMYINSAAGAYQWATSMTMDADGFTISWTKGGSPTGTATLRFAAFK